MKLTEGVEVESMRLVVMTHVPAELVTHEDSPPTAELQIPEIIAPATGRSMLSCTRIVIITRQL
jgi:hypothetical protein